MICILKFLNLRQFGTKKTYIKMGTLHYILILYCWWYKKRKRLYNFVSFKDTINP